MNATQNKPCGTCGNADCGNSGCGRQSLPRVLPFGLTRDGDMYVGECSTLGCGLTERLVFGKTILVRTQLVKDRDGDVQFADYRTAVFGTKVRIFND